MEANEFEPCLRKTVWGIGMVIHGTQWVHRTECSHSWVPPPHLAHHTSGRSWGQQHPHHLGTWWTF